MNWISTHFGLTDAAFPRISELSLPLSGFDGLVGNRLILSLTWNLWLVSICFYFFVVLKTKTIFVNEEKRQQGQT